MRGGVLVAALAVAVLVAVLLRRRSGVTREVWAGERLGPDDLGSALGQRATFVQFSSAVCAPCRATHRVLSDLVAGRADVAHLEVDVERDLELVRRLGVLRTPTVLLLDGEGRVRRRASGAMTPAQARTALAALGAEVDGAGRLDGSGQGDPAAEARAERTVR